MVPIKHFLQVCEEVYQDECHTEYTEECKKTYEEICKTEFLTDCKQEYQEICNTEYSTECKTEYIQVFSGTWLKLFNGQCFRSVVHIHTARW